jgi:uncharacterized membrane protein YebE (DUF533 family)
MRFVCSFAWADFEIRNEERRFIAELVRKLRLDPAERQMVEKWLTLPPEPESVDPALVPRRHRELFLAAIESLVSIDGDVSPEEEDSLAVLRQLVR